MTSECISCSSPIDIEKASVDYVEDYRDTPGTLDANHYNYLIKRHGSVYIDPLSSRDPLDRLNWPERKKNFKIIFIAFQTFSSSFMAAGLTPPYESMALKYERGS